MSSRKRRSNRLTPAQLEQQKDDRECRLHQLTLLIGFGQTHLEWWESLYRSVSLKVALKMVRDGEAEQFEAATENGTIVLFRELKPFANMQYALPTMPTAACAEALAANTPGARISGRDRDRVEHILAFPFVGDVKAPLIQPRVTERDRDAARVMFLRADGKRLATAGHCYRSIRTLHPDLPAAA